MKYTLTTQLAYNRKTLKPGTVEMTEEEASEINSSNQRTPPVLVPFEPAADSSEVVVDADIDQGVADLYEMVTGKKRGRRRVETMLAELKEMGTKPADATDGDAADGGGEE